MTIKQTPGRIKIVVRNGDKKVGSVTYACFKRHDKDVMYDGHQFEVDWLMHELDHDFGADNWTSFEYFKHIVEE